MVNIVTGNTKKFEQMKTVLERFNVVAKRITFDIPEIQSLHAEEIISAKARSAFEHVQQPILVDDTGFYLERFPLFPGVYAKYVYQALGFEGLFQLINDGDKANFKTFVAYMDDSLPSPKIFTGEYTGHCITSPADTGAHEMPYAEFFVPEGATKSMAQMTMEERQNDHRTQALQSFAEWYHSR